MASRSYLLNQRPPPEPTAAAAHRQGVHHGAAGRNFSTNAHQHQFGEHSHPAVAMASTAAATSSGGSSPVALILAFAIAGGITCLVVLGLSAVIVYNRFKSSRTSPFDPANPLRPLQRFSYRQLKSATGSFSNEAKLGQGGFGPVYKGRLRSGLLVAVKNLDSASLQGEREFQNELCVIGGVRSPHIVGLLGFCAERKRRLLVYEFMTGRSLQEALFDEEYPASLDWKMRFSIILDIAQALAFLHFRCDPPIIHGDLKPSNVLLDEDFRAKIADFGLARVKAEVAAGSEIRSEEVDRESSLDFRDHKRLDKHDRDKERWQQRKRRKEAHRRDGKKEEATPECQDKDAAAAAAAGVGAAGGAAAAAAGEVLVSRGGQGVAAAAAEVKPSSSDVEKPGLARQSSGSAFSFHCECPGSDAIVEIGCWKIESKRLEEPEVLWSAEVDHQSTDGDHLVLEVEESPNASVPRPVTAAHDGEAAVGPSSRDWWRKSESPSDDNAIVKDYTVDWLACEVKSGRSRSRDWTCRDDTAAASKGQCQLRDWLKTPDAGPSPACCFGEFSLKDRVGRSKKLQQQQQQQRRRRQSRTECNKEFSGNLTKSREWWKEEYVEELSNKSRELKGERCRKNGRSRDMSWSFDFSGDLSNKPGGGREWWSGDLLHWIHRSRGDSGTIDFSGDLNAQRDRTWSRDRWSGELTSRAMSSTTSMRGTVCYVAPEYGGGGLLSEKSDVYSFGVLMLVIISGRRPLQVVSPSVEFERANLTTWARHLAHNGDVLDLVDASLRGEFVKEQARDCIMLALQCLQRIPAVRPSMADVVRILSGETQLAVTLPELFSPSPPPGSSPRFSSQWKQQSSSASEHAGEHPLLAD